MPEQIISAGPYYDADRNGSIAMYSNGNYMPSVLDDLWLNNIPVSQALAEELIKSPLACVLIRKLLSAIEPYQSIGL